MSNSTKNVHEVGMSRTRLAIDARDSRVQSSNMNDTVRAFCSATAVCVRNKRSTVWKYAIDVMAAINSRCPRASSFPSSKAAALGALCAQQQPYE